jgi:ADP-heptose:LPS heptosyltransferase
MEGCRLFIGNDSGISHLAAALGIPTVAIFGPTDPKVWSPKGRNIAVVRQEIPCSPCPQERFFQCRHFECLKGVEMEHVLDGIRSRIRKRASRRRSTMEEKKVGEVIKFFSKINGSHSSD